MDNRNIEFPGTGELAILPRHGESESDGLSKLTSWLVEEPHQTRGCEGAKFQFDTQGLKDGRPLF